MNPSSKPLNAQQAADRAAFYWDDHLLCAESVLAAVADHQGISSPLIPKIASGFCSGKSETKGTCGALNGGILALSMMLGHSEPDDDRAELYKKVQALHEAFETQFTHTSCPVLLNVDVSTEEGRSAYEANNLHSQCARHIRAMTEKVVELLEA